MMWGYGYGWGGALAMTIGMALWIGVLAVVIWTLVRWSTNRRTQVPGEEDTPPAEEILRQRYARGEIDAATFERMTAQLTEAKHPMAI